MRRYTTIWSTQRMWIKDIWHAHNIDRQRVRAREKQREWNPYTYKHTHTHTRTHTSETHAQPPKPPILHVPFQEIQRYTSIIKLLAKSTSNTAPSKAFRHDTYILMFKTFTMTHLRILIRFACGKREPSHKFIFEVIEWNEREKK